MRTLRLAETYMKDFINKQWQRVIAFHKGRRVTAILDLKDDALFEVEYDKIFDSGKRLSDFVGMIVRLAFVQFAWRYFFYAAPNVSGIYKFILGFCGVSALGLTAILGARIATIIFLWEASDFRKTSGPIGRKVILAIAIASTIVLYLGTQYLVSDLAKHSALLGTKPQ